MPQSEDERASTSAVASSEERGAVTVLAEQIERLRATLDRLHLSEYVKLLDRPWQLVWLNLLAGVARGLGTAIGFTLLGALLIYILQRSFLQNLPIIGRIIAELVKIVDRQLNR